MSMSIGTTSALDITLRGSIGDFKVGDYSGKGTLEVKYFLTHVGLDLSGSQNQKLLRELAPVREIFDITNLEFDEIMQRDIDDARVSSEMIPYILDNKNQGVVKFFPPIVVVCLPIDDDRNKPSAYYPSVTKKKNNEKGGNNEGWQVIQSGEIGSEVFKFKQPIVNGKPSQHDLVEFSVNTSKCRLVIVDGQHRAMALLALYRNLKDGWADSNRRAYKSYYEEWTPDYIRQFNLDDIQLPMIICTIPDLQDNYSGDFDLKKACRSIFLTLNKNAKKVSTTRNLLLNDNDLISSFMRRTLSEIKTFDNRSESSLAIHCVELDQDENKQKITNEIANTGVSHIYYMIEHIMLNESGVSGVSNRSGRYSTRVNNKKIQVALSRLDCFNLLGQDATSTIRRDLFETEEEKTLVDSFFKKYGKYIVEVFSKFSAFDSNNRAANQLKLKLESHQNVLLKPMLFDGQGMIRTFESHRENLSKKLSEGEFGSNAPRIIDMVDKLNITNKSLAENIDMFKNTRAKFLLKKYPSAQYLDEQGKVKAKVLGIINDMYDNIFRTVAFQCALVATYFDIHEKYSKQSPGTSQNIDQDKKFNEYLSIISKFFSPETFPQFKNIVGIFVGQVKGDNFDTLEINKNTADTFRQVVYPGEMQPDAWPVYRYLLLEIWKPSKEHCFYNVIKNEIKKSRSQVANNLYNRTKTTYMRDNFVQENDFNHDAQKEVQEKTIDNYKKFMSYLSKSSEISSSLISV